MKTSELIALALAGVALWLMVAPRRASATPASLGNGLVLPSIFHPADGYAGTWTANGPMVPSAYDKQIWD